MRPLSALAQRPPARSTLTAPVYHRLAARPTRRVAARAADGDAPPPKPPLDDDELWIERELRSRKKKRDAAAKAAAAAGAKPATGGAASGGPLSGAAALEQGYVRFLAAFFGLILLDGIVLATSGFLPEAVDVFAENVLYPTFSPLIGVFLLFSSLYGLWKAGSQGGVDKL